MTEIEIEACYRDTSRILADWHRETVIAFSFRVYEQVGDTQNDPPEYGPEWVVEIRLGPDRHSLRHIETLDCEAWKATRETPGAWRDLVVASLADAERALSRPDGRVSAAPS